MMARLRAAMGGGVRSARIACRAMSFHFTTMSRPAGWICRRIWGGPDWEGVIGPAVSNSINVAAFMMVLPVVAHDPKDMVSHPGTLAKRVPRGMIAGMVRCRGTVPVVGFV